MEFYLQDVKQSRSDAASRAGGLLYSLKKFDTFFYLQMMLVFFSRMETVNAALQTQDLHFQQAASKLDVLRADIKSLREGFQDFWEKTRAAADTPEFGIQPPAVPRQKKTPVLSYLYHDPPTEVFMSDPI